MHARVFPRRVLVYAMLFLMTGISYLDRVNLSVSAGSIARELGFSPVQLGWLFSGFLWTYIVFLVVAGKLVDRVGHRWVAPAAVALWSVATASTGLASGWAGLAASRFVLGIGEAAAWPVGMSTLRAWAPRREYGIGTASISLGQSAGGAFGALLVGWLVLRWGWRASFAATGAIGLAWALAWVLLVRDPARAPWLSAVEREEILRTRDRAGDDDRRAVMAPATSLRILLESRALWGTTLGQGCLVYGYYMLLTWLPNYLQTERHIAVFKSGVATFAIYGAAVVGGLALGRVSDRLWSVEALRGGARRLFVVASIAPATLMATTPWLPAGWPLIVVLAVAVTFLANAISLNAALCNDLVRSPADCGKAIGLFTSGSNVVGVMAPIATGYLVGASGRFDGAFLLTGAVLVVGALILLVVVRGDIGAPPATEHPAPLAGEEPISA